MFEEDRAPVTLTETYQNSDSCQRSIELADRCRSTFKQFPSLKLYRDIVSESTSIRDYKVRRRLSMPDRCWLLNPMRLGVLNARCF